jgi:hypothetical protein
MQLRRSASLMALAALVPIAGAPCFAADQERHVVVSGTDLNGPPPECLRWPYPALPHRWRALASEPPADRRHARRFVGRHVLVVAER